MGGFRGRCPQRAPPLIFAETGASPHYCCRDRHLIVHGHLGAAAFLHKMCLCPIEHSWISPCFKAKFVSFGINCRKSHLLLFCTQTKIESVLCSFWKLSILFFLKSNVSILKQIVWETQKIGIKISVGHAVLELLITILFWSIIQKPLGLLKF